jgi:hypothetical protein
MNRRNFLSKSAVLTSGLMVGTGTLAFPGSVMKKGRNQTDRSLFELFTNPDLRYHPFVRWWWNGDKVEAKELIRELRLLKEAGIGGVEINPIEFPKRFDGDDLGKKSLKWLSDEWIEMLKVVFEESKSLGMTCDLLVGSGWPFGAENLQGEERSQIVVIAVRKLTGPLDYEISFFDLFKEADPAVSSPFPGRTMELLSLKLVPDLLTGISDVTDLPYQSDNVSVKFSVPEGKHALYGLIKINGFMQVINGAPGATGPVLNHFNKTAVKKYLNNMSETIQGRIGPLSGRIRALFTDSMELEGADWSQGIMQEFEKRRGYDLFPYLPFVLFKTGAMGNVTDFKYGVNMTPEFEGMIRRMRYDFELTKAELLEENFIKPYTEWCRQLNVKSRAQAYGRGFFPLEGSFAYDIPECESWTTNWLKHKVGEEMPDSDYRRGRAYTMINKYVSSAANLTGKKLVSCEEMTDTYTVFNTTLENLKIGGDQSAITGVSQTVFHGFNYSPPEAPYPGWIRYGGYLNENNTWWPWFKIYNEYKARLSAVLQQVTMYTDIAILPPLTDMWSHIGAQMEPFPSITYADYLSLVWEAINKNGSGCDYVSERIIRDSEMKKGSMCYGPRKYQTLFLVGVESLDTNTAKKLLDFIECGGRIFCLETFPSRSSGWNNHLERDSEVLRYIEKMKQFTERFILLKKPSDDFVSWYHEIKEKYNIKSYLTIEKPDPYVMQNRYQAADGTELILIINSNINTAHQTKITFSEEISSGKTCWLWEPDNGNRSRVPLAGDNSINLRLGPADLFLFVFDKQKEGKLWNPVPSEGISTQIINSGWNAEFRHCHDGSVRSFFIDTLRDLKDIPEYVSFSGIVVYRNSFMINNPEGTIINLGKVYGLAEIIINGKSFDVQWFGQRSHRIGNYLKPGINTVEIRLATTMGNYMKSLTDNPIAQYWTNEKNKNQPLQSMGLIGPVTIYSEKEK